VLHRISALLIAAWFISGCSSPHRVTRLGDDFTLVRPTIPKDRAQVVAIVQDFAGRNQSLKDRLPIMFLSLSGADPPESFLRELQSTEFQIKPLSAANASAKGVSDKLSAKEGFIFEIEGFRWINDSRVECELRCFVAGLAVSGNTYTLTKAGGTWKVTDRKTKWVS